MDKWPGRWQTRFDLMASMGDERDWFRYGHKYEAYRQACVEFMDARRRRRSFRNFGWNQILILGDYGVGKTTLGVKFALEQFRRGHPVFSNASLTFGWHLEAEEMYTAMGFMPHNACLLIDEGSAALSGRVGHGVAIATFNEMNLNSRKRSCVCIYMTAMDWELAASIRRNCKEVWRPLPQDRLVVEDDDDWPEQMDRVLPRNNPDNFRMAWDVWDDFPYRKSNIIDGKQDDEGFGEPTYTMYDDGDNVRRAYMLNDSFQLAQAGAATMADRNVVKSNLETFLVEAQPGAVAAAEGSLKWKMEKVIQYFIDEANAGGGPAFYKPATIARYLDVDPAEAGRLLQRVIPVAPAGRKGYPADKIFGWLDRMSRAGQGENLWGDIDD